ncbi:hypothetical protein [Streptomyces minutiscleroticus]|uniref:hypothetical protein n=1 Tax=Streptomyces minutiscleroticus TaxID=68238 RepID=UPI00332BBEE5
MTVPPGGTVTVSVTCAPAGGPAPDTVEARSQAFEKGTAELRRVPGADAGSGEPDHEDAGAEDPVEPEDGEEAVEPGGPGGEEEIVEPPPSGAGGDGAEPGGPGQDGESADVPYLDTGSGADDEMPVEPPLPGGEAGPGNRGGGGDGGNGAGAAGPSYPGDDGKPAADRARTGTGRAAPAPGGGDAAGRPAYRGTARVASAGKGDAASGEQRVEGACPGTPDKPGERWSAAFTVSHDGGPGTGDDAGPRQGAQAGGGGAFTDSVPAQIAGGLLIAWALGSAVHRLCRRGRPHPHRW